MLKEPFLGAVSPVYVVARPTYGYQWYLDFMIRLPQTREWISVLAMGTVRQSLSYQDFANIPCVIPSRRVVASFNKELGGLRASSTVRADEIDSLANLRDVLLPKLICGELCFGEFKLST